MCWTILFLVVTHSLWAFVLFREGGIIQLKDLAEESELMNFPPNQLRSFRETEGYGYTDFGR